MRPYLYWYRVRNFGDMLAPFLFLRIARRLARFCNVRGERLPQEVEINVTVGSLLEHLGHNAPNCVLWGPGLIAPLDSKMLAPKCIRAVRGPLTRAELVKQGIDCPAVYGDPALLLPRLYNPRVNQRYTVGIIPHYVDWEHPWVQRQRSHPGTLVLDVRKPVRRFIRDLKSCEVILSSSLHGIIGADAYGIPSFWIEISDRVLGEGFKFRDYFASVGVEPYEPRHIESEDVPLQEVCANAREHALDIDLDLLMNACPFLPAAGRM